MLDLPPTCPKTRWPDSGWPETPEDKRGPFLEHMKYRFLKLDTVRHPMEI